MKALKSLALVLGLGGVLFPEGAREAMAAPGGAADPTTGQSARAMPRLPQVSLPAVRSGQVGVPAVVPRRVPGVLASDAPAGLRKDIFLRTVLPAVLRVNANLRRDRRFVARAAWLRAAGQQLDATTHMRLTRLAERYRTDPDDLKTLRRRVDTLPPSLVLAQAAIESGWGRSRFAQSGNALFGQRSYHCSDCGMVPRGYGEDPGFRVVQFKSVAGSVRAYLRNLNTHPAYAALRQARAAARRAGRRLDSQRLATFLTRYSERGAAYVADVQATIAANDLRAFDTARLAWYATPAGLWR